MRKIDFNSFSTNGKPGKASKSDADAANRRWWLMDKDELPGAIHSVIRSLTEYDSKRQTQYQISARLYGNVNLMGLNGLTLSKIISANNTLKDRISYNLVQSVIDTVTAKLAKNKPKPMFLTTGGNYKMQRRAKDLDLFIDGIFYENKAHKHGVQNFREGCVFGDGFMKVLEENGRVKFERTLASELYVDTMEAFYGHPRQLHQTRNVDRAVLADMFPKMKGEIMDAEGAKSDLTGAYQHVSDQITVAESWHLRSGPNAKDGRKVITINNHVLDDDKTWQKDRFPFARFAWAPRLYGYWSQGLAEQLQNIQLEINKLLWIIQRSMHMAGTFKIFAENGSKVVKEHFTNDFGTILFYTGTPPQYIVPPIVPPEIYSHLQTLIRQGFEQSGISMLSAASQKPAGLNSGKALSEYNDIESDRFMVVGQAYEDYFMDLGDLAIDQMKDIYERDKKYSIKVPTKSQVRELDWGDIDLEKDDYIMQAFPVSSLPNEPAERLQTITDYMQAGLLSPRAGRRLLDFPDLERAEQMANAEEDYLNKLVDNIVDEGIFDRIDVEVDDPNLAKEIALEKIAYCKANGVEPAKIQMLKDFLEFIDKDQQNIVAQAQAQLQAQAPQPMAGAQPQAPAQPMAASPMVPNVPQQLAS